MKYIFVTGGVVSGLGKGITAASLGRLLKCRFSFGFRSNCYGILDASQMFPFLKFRLPCISCYTKRCDNKDLLHLKCVKTKVLYSGQGYDAFSQSHIKQNCCNRMFLNEFCCIRLIIMRYIFHQLHLLWFQGCQCRKPKSRVILTAVFCVLEAVGVFCPVL